MESSGKGSISCMNGSSSDSFQKLEQERRQEQRTALTSPRAPAMGGAALENETRKHQACFPSSDLQGSVTFTTVPSFGKKEQNNYYCRYPDPSRDAAVWLLSPLVNHSLHGLIISLLTQRKYSWVIGGCHRCQSCPIVIMLYNVFTVMFKLLTKT